MKSYYKFLETTKPLGERVSATRKPVFRSSAIFPVIHSQSYATCVSFMGYWLMKRQIREVSVLYTLRDKSGQILLRNSLLVDEARVYVLEIAALRREAGLLQKEEAEFYGSLEIEVFSTRNLFITYPAIVLCFYNDSFSTAVHTTGRIYNDIEDLQENEESRVAESGFDIYGDPEMRPFCAFTHGPLPHKTPEIAYTVINHRLEEFQGVIRLSPLAAYETVFLYFKDYIDLAPLLDGKAGLIKLRHNLKGFFPRFIGGNFESSKQSASITHTFYDCSSAVTPQDYWDKKNPQNHDASIMIPLFLEEDAYTDLVFYPIYSPSVFEFSLDFYGSEGNRLAHIPQHKRFDARKPIFTRIDFRSLVQEKKLDPSKVRAAHLIFNAAEGFRIPTRIKMGLNVGMLPLQAQLPCNICFAPKVGDPDALKNRSFHWAPLLNFGDSKLVITNDSASKDYSRSANVRLNFFRASDDDRKCREICLTPFAQYRVDLAKEPDLRAFFEDKIGWATVESDNPHVYGWYFDFHRSGAVAGDHFF